MTEEVTSAARAVAPAELVPGSGAACGSGQAAASLASVLEAAGDLSLSEASSGSLEADIQFSECETVPFEEISTSGSSSTAADAGTGPRVAVPAPSRGAPSGLSSHPLADDGCQLDDSWQPSPGDVAAAASCPVLVAAHPGLPYQRISPAVDPCSLPVNDGSAIEFDTPLFSGRACVWIRGVPGGRTAGSKGGAGAGPGAADAMFAGRRRRTLVTVQGRFKAAQPVDDIVTGQEFERVENLPPAWIVDGVLLRVARAVSPSMEIGPAAKPYMLMPVISGCSEIHACQPGQEPPVWAPPHEDLRAWDPSLTAPDGSPLHAAKRKAFFSRPANRAGRSFPTDLVFTFYFYQHVVDASTYELDVLYRFDLCKYLAGQPLQLMMRQRSTGQYLYCLHLWHKRLLQAAG